MFAERLKIERTKIGISQSEIATALKLSRQAYSHYETGKREPTQEILKQIAEILNCSTDYLLGITDEPKTLDEQLDGISFALYSEAEELTDEEKQDVLDYIRYKKMKKES